MAAKVIVTRAPGDFRGGEVDADIIDRVEWDDVSGGVKKRQGGYSLYGYIPYSLAKNIGIACSGKHDFGDNDAKICIPASANKGAYREGYRSLLEQAGSKPRSKICKSRPEGQGPCTKKILNLLSENDSQKRGDLRKTINELGYETKTFRQAIKSLQKQEKILVDGSSYSYNQIIRLNEEK